MKPVPTISSADPGLGRRQAVAAIGSGLLVLGLAACGLKPKEYGPGEKPFWEEERQED